MLALAGPRRGLGSRATALDSARWLRWASNLLALAARLAARLAIPSRDQMSLRLTVRLANIPRTRLRCVASRLLHRNVREGHPVEWRNGGTPSNFCNSRSFHTTALLRFASAPPPSQQPGPGLPPKLPAPRENIYTFPNLLTVSRIIACPVLSLAIVSDNFYLATGLLVYAGLTDLV